MRVFRSSVITGAPAGAPGSFALLRRVALAGLITLALLALGVVVAPGRAYAAPPGAKITFVMPVYQGSAEGPVGAQVTVQGSGWDPNTTVNITLADKSNDTSGQPGSACTNGSTLFTGATTSSDGMGNVMTSFLWPSGTGIIKGHSYWACGDEGTPPASLGTDYYTVLSTSPPSAQTNVSQATAGSSITVTGQNWLPGNQQVEAVVAPCIACTPPYSTNAQTIAKADGTFSLQVQVPNQAPVGTKLYVSVENTDPNNMGALHTEPTNTPTFTVVAQPTATPTPTNTATPTATSTTTATSTANGGTGGNNGNGGGSGGSSGSGNGSGLLIILLSALGVVLLAAAVVAVLLFLRSRGPAPGTVGGGGSRGSYPPSRGYNQYNPPRRTGARPPTNPRYPETNIDYYGGQRQSPGWGGWQGDPQGPDDDEDFGDAPTVGPNRPWR